MSNLRTLAQRQAEKEAAALQSNALLVLVKRVGRIRILPEELTSLTAGEGLQITMSDEEGLVLEYQNRGGLPEAG